MFRSLRTTIEYTSSVFKYNRDQRVKENHGKGWVAKYLTDKDPLLVVEGKRYHRFALELGKFYCYIEIMNPLIFPSYIRINGRPHMLLPGQELIHNQHGRKIVINRLKNTRNQNYYILVRTN